MPVPGTAKDKTMEPFYIVLRADLSGMAGHYPDEQSAREIAQKLCEKQGKPFIVARVIGRVEVDRFPVKWLDADEPDTSE